LEPELVTIAIESRANRVASFRTRTRGSSGRESSSGRSFGCGIRVEVRVRVRVPRCWVRV